MYKYINIDIYQVQRNSGRMHFECRYACKEKWNEHMKYNLQVLAVEFYKNLGIQSDVLFQ